MPTARLPGGDVLRDAELSRLVGRRVRDGAGVPLGRLGDLAIALSGPSPAVLAAEVRSCRDRS
jgi:hypothetical protein